jgi:hypothetical protein
VDGWTVLAFLDLVREDGACEQERGRGQKHDGASIVCTRRIGDTADRMTWLQIERGHGLRRAAIALYYVPTCRNGSNSRRIKSCSLLSASLLPERKIPYLPTGRQRTRKRPISEHIETIETSFDPVAAGRAFSLTTMRDQCADCWLSGFKGSMHGNEEAMWHGGKWP